MPDDFTDAQAQFHATPTRATALAYMDAAIAENIKLGWNQYVILAQVCNDVRDWLMIEVST